MSISRERVGAKRGGTGEAMNSNECFLDFDEPMTEKEMKALEKRAIEVVKPLIPPDAEDRVKRTVKQFNDIVRKHIRTETGLKLASETSNESVPIKFVKGFPVQIAQLINKNDELLLWRLITIQPKLGGVVEGLNAVLDYWNDYSNWKRLPEIARDQSETVRRTRDIALELQKLAAAKQIIDQVREIHEDIFGAYIYTNYSQTIELYWMSLAIFSSSFGVRIEDLTVVVTNRQLS